MFNILSSRFPIIQRLLNTLVIEATNSGTSSFFPLIFTLQELKINKLYKIIFWIDMLWKGLPCYFLVLVPGK